MGRKAFSLLLSPLQTCRFSFHHKNLKDNSIYSRPLIQKEKKSGCKRKSYTEAFKIGMETTLVT